MRIEVTGKKLDLTDVLVSHVNTKCEKLPQYFDGVMEIDVVLEQAEHGEFATEVVVDVVKHDRFVSHGRDHSIYVSIDQAVDKMTRQLRDFKEKLRKH